jgi:hypothetical protein
MESEIPKLKSQWQEDEWRENVCRSLLPVLVNFYNTSQTSFFRHRS